MKSERGRQIGAWHRIGSPRDRNVFISPRRSRAACGGQPCFHGIGTTPGAAAGAGPCERAETTSVCFCCRFGSYHLPCHSSSTSPRSPSPLSSSSPPPPLSPPPPPGSVGKRLGIHLRRETWEEGSDGDVAGRGDKSSCMQNKGAGGWLLVVEQNLVNGRFPFTRLRLHSFCPALELTSEYLHRNQKVNHTEPGSGRERTTLRSVATCEKK